MKKESEVLAALSPGCRHVWATFWVEAEVNNGGFDQYFLNTSGAYATIAAEGFRAIGGEEYSKLTLEAIAIHKNDNGRNGRNPLFNPLDDAFYDLETTKPLDLLRAKYIDAHPDEFPK